METAEYTQRPSTERGRRRRDRIIREATRLFDERGYHATGIDDIGAAAGITGPGVYRHFSGKDEILIAVFDRIWMMLRVGLDAAADQPPRDALATLIDQHVAFVVDRRAEMALLVRQLANLPADYQRRAAGNRDRYEAAWVEPLVHLRPDWTDGERHLTVRAVLWMLNSYALEDPAPDPDAETVRRVLVGLARTALVLGGSGARED